MWSKNVRYHLIFSVIIFSFMLISLALIFELRQYQSETFSFFPTSFIVVFYILLGAILGAEGFMMEKKKAGAWKMNWYRLILVGLPSVYFSIYIPLYFFLDRVISLPSSYLNSVILQSNLTSFAGVILGYIIITSFQKVNADGNSE